MKKLITIAIVCCFAGAAYAGCGTKVDVKGKLSGYDAEKKELTVSGKKDGDEKKITLEATVVVKNDKGEDATIDDLVGKRVTISTDKHTKKAEVITLAAAKKKKDE